MAKLPSKTPLTLLIDDQGVVAYGESGQRLARLPDPEPGFPLRSLWTPVLSRLAEPGTELQIILDQTSLLLQCQEVPFLNPREQRDVATRVFAAEIGTGELLTAAALDLDPMADGGQVLWLGATPRTDMDQWLDAIAGADLLPVMAMPLQRALIQGLDSLKAPFLDWIVLAAVPGSMGHLCYFHGRALTLQRSFSLPPDQDSAEELIYEEVGRLLQFIKQKNRELVFAALHIVGLPDLSPAFSKRLEGSLRLETVQLAPLLWPVLLEGLKRERAQKDGLNLLPREVQEATRLRVFKGTVWASAITLGLLFGAATLFLYGQELAVEREVQRATRLLAEREAQVAKEERIVQVRLPLLRVKLAEQRQGRAAATLARLGTILFRAPQGIQLEKVDIAQNPSTPITHTFTVTGLAFSERGFSMGPLAQYLAALGQEPGLSLAPMTEASTSDRVVQGQDTRPDQMAITRFTLTGSSR